MSKRFDVIHVDEEPAYAILAAVISTSGALVAPVMPSASSNAPTATSAPYDLSLIHI